MARVSSVSSRQIIKTTIAMRVKRNIRGPKGWYWPSSRNSASTDAVRAEEGTSSIQNRSSGECDGICDGKINFKDMSSCVIRDGRLNIEADEVVERRVQITRALKGKGIKYISRIFMMGIIMR